MRLRTPLGLIVVDTEAPFDRYWDTFGAASGEHQLGVKAYYFTGNTSQKNVVVSLD